MCRHLGNECRVRWHSNSLLVGAIILLLLAFLNTSRAVDNLLSFDLSSFESFGWRGYVRDGILRPIGWPRAYELNPKHFDIGSMVFDCALALFIVIGCVAAVEMEMRRHRKLRMWRWILILLLAGGFFMSIPNLEGELAWRRSEYKHGLGLIKRIEVFLFYVTGWLASLSVLGWYSIAEDLVARLTRQEVDSK